MSMLKLWKNCGKTSNVIYGAGHAAEPDVKFHLRAIVLLSE